MEEIRLSPPGRMCFLHSGTVICRLYFITDLMVVIKGLFPSAAPEVEKIAFSFYRTSEAHHPRTQCSHRLATVLDRSGPRPRKAWNTKHCGIELQYLIVLNGVCWEPIRL